MGGVDDGGGIINGKAKEPMHKMVAKWHVEVSNMLGEIERNPWKIAGFEWF